MTQTTKWIEYPPLIDRGNNELRTLARLAIQNEVSNRYAERLRLIAAVIANTNITSAVERYNWIVDILDCGWPRFLEIEQDYRNEFEPF